MQSDFRAHHSTETALLSLLSGIYTAMDKSHVTLMLHTLHYSMLRRHLIWWIMKSCYNVLRLPLAFLALLFIGFARTILIALIWWYWVTHALLGFLSNLVSLRALLGPLLYSLFTADISRLFAKYSASGHLYADDAQFISMVLLLNSLILLHLLHLLLLILILGCFLIVCHLILPRPN